MKKGDIVTGIVESIGFGDKGRVRTSEGDIITVKGTLPGQKVEVRILRKKGGAYKGMLLNVLEKAPLQTESRCPHFPECGGCTYQHYEHSSTEELKENQVKELLSGVLNKQSGTYSWLPRVDSPLSEGYRNKMEYTFGDSYKDGPLELGLHKKGSFYDIVSVPECRITNPDFGIITRAAVDYFRQLDTPYFHRRDHKGYLRHLLVRRSESTKELLVGIVTTTQMDMDLSGFKDAVLNAGCEGKIAGVIHIKNDSLSDVVKCDSMNILYGRDYFYENMLGLSFKVSLFSFFQTNSLGAERLYKRAGEFLGKSKISYSDKIYSCNDYSDKETGVNDDKTVSKSDIEYKESSNLPVIYDLYSGTGTIAQMMAPYASRVYGVEIVEDAVIAARENAALNGLTNCEFIAGDVLKVLEDIEKKPDVIILDPPREGVHPRALSRIIDYGVDKILYISCKPTSLANDLETFIARGYEVEKICTVSMFPSTVHVESVVLITRKDK